MNPYFSPSIYTNAQANYPNLPNYMTTSPTPLSSQAQGAQLTRVNGIESARAYPTNPNSTVALFDENEDIMYIKSTDASNFPTIRKFRFIEEKEQLDIDNAKYVTMEEFEKFKEEVLNGKQFVRSNKSTKHSNEQSSTSKRYDDNPKDE